MTKNKTLKNKTLKNKTLKNKTLKNKTLKNKKGRQLDYIRNGRLSYEGKNIRRELKKINKLSKLLDKKIRNYDDLPEWVQKKIILASDYIRSSYEYIDYKVNSL